MNDSRHIPILGSNGAPTKVHLGVQYSPGPLATPVVLPPLSVEGEFLAPAFGGATRMEAVASRLLAGAMDWEELDRCGRDAAFRRRLIQAATVTAWELIGYASEFRGAPIEDAPPEDSPSDERRDEAPESPIVMP